LPHYPLKAAEILSLLGLSSPQCDFIAISDQFGDKSLSFIIPQALYLPLTCIFATRCYASMALAIMQCLSVCSSVCQIRGLCQNKYIYLENAKFVDCVKTNTHILKMFSPSGSHTILVFLHTNVMQMG